MVADLRDERAILVDLLEVHLQFGELLLHLVQLHANILALPLAPLQLLPLLRQLHARHVVRPFELLLQRELDPLHRRLRARTKAGSEAPARRDGGAPGGVDAHMPRIQHD